MTPQEIFDKAIGGVIRQGDLATDSNGGCSYRTDDGRACGVGQLTDDETANAWDELEKSSIAQIAHDRGLPEHLEGHLELLKDIQTAHDEASEYLEDAAPRLLRFLVNAREVAVANNLEMKFTDQDVLEALS